MPFTTTDAAGGGTRDAQLLMQAVVVTGDETRLHHEQASQAVKTTPCKCTSSLSGGRSNRRAGRKCARTQR